MKIGVFVDAENIKMNGGYHMRYDILRRFAGRGGGLLLRLNTYLAFDRGRAESDPEYKRKTSLYQQAVRDLGWKIVVKEVRHYKDEDGRDIRKANSDLDLAVDVMLQSDNLDYVLMVTGDGDFLQVVRALQDKGTRVELLAFQNISRDLIRQVDAFYNGYLIPDLMPFQDKNNWGALGNYVRGVPHKWFSDKGKGGGYGFLRFIKNISPNLWVTDHNDPESPYQGVYCHATELIGLTHEDMQNRDTIVEFSLRESKEHRRLSAAGVRPVAGIHQDARRSGVRTVSSSMLPEMIGSGSGNESGYTDSVGEWNGNQLGNELHVANYSINPESLNLPEHMDSLGESMDHANKDHLYPTTEQIEQVTDIAIATQHPTSANEVVPRSDQSD